MSSDNKPENIEKKTTKIEATIRHSAERLKFRSLLLSNPNYFGNLKINPFTPVKSKVKDTTYEELKCVGFNPELNLLKAVVWVKLTSGYSGGICSNGSPEYVRMYLSFDNGSSWQDQGMVNFTAYDLPGPKPLEYAVTIQPKRYWTSCAVELLPKVRAILSWNDAPPPNQPDWLPVWGNSIDAHIQIPAQQQKFSLVELAKHAKIELPKNISSLIDVQQPIKPPPAKVLTLADLHAQYKDKGVQMHRFLYPAVTEHLDNPDLINAYQAYGSDGPLASLEVDLGEIMAALEKTNGDTGYEELGCVGLDPNFHENLVGVLRVKRPYGYSGLQCDDGSFEYIAFWVDWADGTGWNWVGTARINVHDFRTIPAGGLQYGVEQPVNLAVHRRPCQQGAVTARVRAILSWQTMPPPWDPDYRPTWGNRIETRIHIPPGESAQTGDYTPYLDTVCGVPLCSIDPISGFAPGDRPFGRRIRIFGDIPGSPDVLTPIPNRPRYKIMVSPHPIGVEETLINPFAITLEERIGANVTSTPFTQTVDPSNQYTYQEAPPSPHGWRRVSPSRLLGVWHTDSKAGLWKIRIQAWDPVTDTTYPAGSKLCVIDGTTRQDVVVKLDNERPGTSIGITHYSRDNGATWHTASACGTFQVGDIIKGIYGVSDDHFGSLELTVQPNGIPGAHGTAISPETRSYPAVPTTGETGEWTLDTKDMDPCGYTVWLEAWDRTIVNCGPPWENEGAFVGFCLVEAPDE
jgi:hypothetical protein